MTLNDHYNAYKELTMWYNISKIKPNLNLYTSIPFCINGNQFFNWIKYSFKNYEYGQTIEIIRPGRGEQIYFVCQSLIELGFDIEKFWNDLYIMTDFSNFDNNFKDEKNELIYYYRNKIKIYNLKEAKNMNFDHCIMNPPYNGNSNLYGKITLIAKKYSKDVVCLSPYLNYLETVQKQSVKDNAAQLLPTLEEYELVKDNVFDAAFDKDLCIFHFIDNPKNKVDINDIYWNQFSNPELTKSIINKIKNYSNFCYDKIISKKKFDDYEFKVAFTGVRGHCINGQKQWDWTTVLDEDKMKNFKYSSNKKEDLMGIPFKSEKECIECVKWINSDIFGYLILIQKHSINMDKWLFKIIPYFDFTKEWDDEKRCKELKLINKEYNYILDEMKDFGWKVKNGNI